jgi:hypothetical protein
MEMTLLRTDDREQLARSPGLITPHERKASLVYHVGMWRINNEYTVV